MIAYIEEKSNAHNFELWLSLRVTSILNFYNYIMPRASLTYPSIIGIGRSRHWEKLTNNRAPKKDIFDLNQTWLLANMVLIVKCTLYLGL